MHWSANTDESSFELLSKTRYQNVCYGGHCRWVVHTCPWFVQVEWLSMWRISQRRQEQCDQQSQTESSMWNWLDAWHDQVKHRDEKRNSLRRVNIVTRQMQTIKLDKLIKLFDSPGIVMSKDTNPANLVLRNCVRVSSDRLLPRIVPNPSLWLCRSKRSRKLQTLRT